MSAIEKDLAEAIIHYEKLKSDKGNAAWIDVDKHLTLLHKWLKRETALRNELERSWSDHDVLEGTAEANRGHQLRMGLS